MLILLSLQLLQPAANVYAAEEGPVTHPAAYDWPMFSRSANHTGAVVSPAPLSNHLVRNVNLSEAGQVRSSPAVANGTLFIARGSTFHALNSSTLSYNATISQGWNYTLPGGGSIYTSPAVGEGKVFFGATDGKLYAFEATVKTCPGVQGCHLLWSFATGDAIYSSPTYDNGKVFVGSNDGMVYAVGASTGVLIWNFTTNGPVKSSPAVAGSKVVVGSDDGKLYVLDESTGKLALSYPANGAIESSPALSAGVAYFGSNNSKVFAVDISTGSTVWKYITGGPVVASPTIADGRVYVGSTDGYFYSFRALHNKIQLVWQVLTGPVIGPSALANGVAKGLVPTYLPLAFVVSTDGNLVAVVRATGALNWTLPIAAGTLSSPVVAYTKVYLVDRIGNLTVAGGLRGGTALALYGLSGPQKKFHPGDSVIIGENTAWGKFGVNRSMVLVTDPHNNIIVDNESMTFIAGLPAYNFVFTLALGGGATTGRYHVTLYLEDANPKPNSPNPRCCGWIVVTAVFKVTL